MKIWLITVGEPLPIDGRVRLYRTGMLAKILADKRHDVVWWTSSFDHVKKKFRKPGGGLVNYEKGFSIFYLKGAGYRKNISILRVIDHFLLMRHFKSAIKNMPRPDIVLCSYPTIELTECAVRYGLKYKLPVLVDVRDLWPDIIIDALPAPLKEVGGILMSGWFKSAKYIFSNCTAILGVSESYLNFGLQYGGRSATRNDRVFPLAYPAPRVEPDAGDTPADDILRPIGIDATKTIFVFVGTFGKTYDLGVVISGIQMLDESILDGLQFVFCGDGEYAVEWRYMARNIPQIVFTGWVNSDILRSLLLVADVGIAAYKAGAPQSIPNKVIEYMSAGLPIISSLAGETKRLLEDGGLGLTYDASNPRDFSACVQELLDINKRKLLSRNCKFIFNKKYRADIVYVELANYLELLAGSEDRELAAKRKCG